MGVQPHSLDRSEFDPVLDAVRFVSVMPPTTGLLNFFLFVDLSFLPVSFSFFSRISVKNVHN